MLKGLYSMGWYRDMWNYHPSLPMKNLQMVEEIDDIHGTMLIWSCLGSGAIGLPYLEREAFDATPPRMRMYGFMNDSEFCQECKKRGITVFSVLWKAQLWEFPAELNEDESQLLSLNLLRGASSNKACVGISELSTNRYPKLFAPMERFFPDGLVNWKGEKVHDFLTEFKTITLEGRDIHSSWLMAPGHDHVCYTPCGNKSSYLAYLKRNVEMMVDAGAGGLHIDEYDAQRFVHNSAGCFCEECLHKFRLYLKAHAVALPPGAGNYDDFDYRAFLLGQGYTDEDLLIKNGNARWDIPLFREFTEMQFASMEWMVAELSAHAKEYAQSTREMALPVTANLYRCMPITWNCKKHLDLLAGEKGNIELRQDGWYKFGFGWLNGKDACFVEDPNAYIREVVEDIRNGINDRFILFALEPLAHGFHLAFPYGSWLQNQERDAFWPDMRVLKSLGPWLDEQEPLFSKNPVANIAVLYDLPSAYEDLLTGPNSHTHSRDNFTAFFGLVQALSNAHVLYNVLFSSADEPLNSERLTGYQTLVVPDAFMMDEATAGIIHDFEASGGRVITFARAPKALQQAPNYTLEQQTTLVDDMKKLPAAVGTDGSMQYGIALHQTDTGYALHIVNYNYDEASHRILNIPKTVFTLGFKATSANTRSFPANPNLCCKLEDNSLTVENAGIYTVVELTTG